MDQKTADHTYLNKRYTLWLCDYASPLPLIRGEPIPYGMKRSDGYIVRHELIVKVVEVRVNVPGIYASDRANVGLRAVTANYDTLEFTQNWNIFPDDSMSPTYYWDITKYLGVLWQPEDAERAYNSRISHVRLDGTRAIPKGVAICPKHDYAYYPQADGYGCMHCRIDKMKKEQLNA